MPCLSFTFHAFFRFEIMIEPESCHNAFRLIQTRDIDHSKLKGLIYDNGCNLGKPSKKLNTFNFRGRGLNDNF